jgi:hypothetical protein
MFRELVLLLRVRCLDEGVTGFRPTAQSGRGGKGCCDEVVDVYVCRDEEEVEDDFNKRLTRAILRKEGYLLLSKTPRLQLGYASQNYCQC